jgi:hypothetical protein
MVIFPNFKCVRAYFILSAMLADIEIRLKIILNIMSFPRDLSLGKNKCLKNRLNTTFDNSHLLKSSENYCKTEVSILSLILEQKIPSKFYSKSTLEISVGSPN